MPIELGKILKVSAWLACAVVTGMIAIFFATGVGQDPLQFVHPSEDYGRLLLRNPGALRATLGLDNLFIVFYSTVFLCQGVLLSRLGASKAVVWIAVSLTGAVAVLDMIENFHFMVMLAQAEQGVMPSATEISAQAFESLLKFHLSYLSLFLLSVALPRRTVKERLLGNLGWFLQLPVGVLIYVTPHAVSLPLVFVRFSYFLTALILVALIFGDSKPQSSPGVAAGSGAPA